MDKAERSLIRCEALSFKYADGPLVFSGVSLTFGAGEFHLVRGPSGTGKSSFLRLLNRLEEPAGGRLFFKDRPYADLAAPELRRQILYIQQTPVVVDGTVRDNLLMPFLLKHNRTLPKPDDQRLRERLDSVSLNTVALTHPARSLSVGQQQRLCLIRGLLLSPAVVLLDEPTSALDDESSRIVEAMAEALCLDSGKTVVMVSHREFRPRRVVPRIIDVRDGRFTVTRGEKA
ncbi:ABC transporter ATP-binding protein [Desulfatiferula olefinivorans]